METTANVPASTAQEVPRTIAAGMRILPPVTNGRHGGESPIRIGLALGGGFARGIAHAGVLRVFEQHGIPIHCVAGVSAGAVVAAAYASGTPAEDIVRVGCSMRFGDVGRLRPGRLGLVSSDRMDRFLPRLLRCSRFEEMRMPLAVLATDLSTGGPACFSGVGGVLEPLRASCAFPGLFEPVRHDGQLLVDGAMSVAVPAALARRLGATHVVSVAVPPPLPSDAPTNVFQVISRCFQILQGHCDDGWRRESDLIIAPEVRGVDWHAFDRGPQLVEAGETAALGALPVIRAWLSPAARVPVEMVA
jgi:NTE family protein